MQKDSYESYISEIKDNISLTYEEERDLVDQILNGSQKAKDELYHRHLKFVISIAKTYKNSFLELTDLISEGNYGMLVALDKFDYTKDVRFMTYAVYWIRHYINNALTNVSRTIRLPSNVINDKEFDESNTHMPTCSSLTSFSNIDKDEVEDNIVFNIQDLANEDETSPLLKEAMSRLVCNLSDREYNIISLYYGLDKQGERNLSEIGDIVGLTKERIRQIKVNAIRKIKANYFSIDSTVFE